ncbi:hypothetical protein [Burkholderia sp. BCC0322]|uniref:hypothetical protein n=1 Tax=unclassified Burkholderia TaxID=2613784 RepID=UPI00158D7ACC|nr:hypothetical protein [Burkholderia sp. BCC0322]
MNHMERLDITAGPIASEVIGNLNTANGIVVLQILKTAAERLDYLFARHPIAASLPDTAMEVLGEALDDIEEGVAGRKLADDLLVALAVEGIFMHMGPSTVGLLRVEQLRRGARAAQGDGFTAPPLDEAETTELEVIQAGPTGSKREPGRIEVDVANDQVVVAAKGSLATYNWRAGAYDNRVARLSIQPMRQFVGASHDDTYRVVAGDVADVHRPSSILADNLSEAEAIDLIERIHNGVKGALGIGAPPECVVQLDESAHVVASVEPARRALITTLLESATNAASRAVRVIVFALATAAVIGAAVVLLPIAFRIGHHLSAYLIEVAFDVYPTLRELLP